MNCLYLIVTLNLKENTGFYVQHIIFVLIVSLYNKGVEQIRRVHLISIHILFFRVTHNALAAKDTKTPFYHYILISITEIELTGMTTCDSKKFHKSY